MTGVRSPRSRYVTWLPTGIAALGPLILLALLVEWRLFNEGSPPFVLSGAQAVELPINGGIAAGITYGGYRMVRSDLGPERYPRVAGWCFGGLLGFLGLNLLLIAFVPTPSLESNVAWARGTAVVGAGAASSSATSRRARWSAPAPPSGPRSASSTPKPGASGSIT